MRSDIYELTYRTEESHWWYVARRRTILSWLTQSLASARPSRTKPRLLDYGCGTGINLVHLAKIGTAFGVDAAPEAIAFCRQRGLQNVMATQSLAETDALAVFGGDFDVVTVLDVLEHLPDEIGALRCIRALLKPGGLLVITVPAFDWLWSGEDVVSEHLRRYTHASLGRVLQKAGFETLRISYFNTLLFPLQAAVVFGNRLLRSRSMAESMVKQLPGMVNGVLTAIVSLESVLLRGLQFPIGASLICSARASEHNARQGAK
jgi:SAM-dependent methyltransferase